MIFSASQVVTHALLCRFNEMKIARFGVFDVCCHRERVDAGAEILDGAGSVVAFEVFERLSNACFVVEEHIWGSFSAAFWFVAAVVVRCPSLVGLAEEGTFRAFGNDLRSTCHDVAVFERYIPGR